MSRTVGSEMKVPGVGESDSHGRPLSHSIYQRVFTKHIYKYIYVCVVASAISTKSYRHDRLTILHAA